LIRLILEMKKRNPQYGYLRIAMQIQNVFDVKINKDVVRRVLTKFHLKNPYHNGPSWLSFLANMKDSLWSVDFFRRESIMMNSHWVMVVMDQYHRWKANLRILEIKEIKTLPYVPLSHPFIERLIKSIRNELLDRTLFWNSHDLQKKLDAYKEYFNQHRSHSSLNILTPNQKSANTNKKSTLTDKYQWKSYCRGLFQLAIAA
jgi:putative transposase